MYVCEIKIKLENDYCNGYYEINKWMNIFEHNGKKCKWIIYKTGLMKFILGNYEDRYDALNDGKMLYFNILYEIHRNEHGFILGDSEYRKKLYHSEDGYTFQDYINNEEYFFYKKNSSTCLLGLTIHENDVDCYIDDLNLEGRITFIKKEPFKFFEKIQELNSEYKYSEKTQKIFGLISLAEQADSATEVLLLCQALETMGKNENKTTQEIEVIDKCIAQINESKLLEEQKNSLIGMLRHGKQISSLKKCLKLIERYCQKDYVNFDKIKVLKDAYTLRSKIIHGESLGKKTDFSCSQYLKIIVLDILKEWSKDHN